MQKGEDQVYGPPPHYGLLCIPSSFLEQEEVEISAYLVQLDYYVPMLFMHWNNLSRAGHCTVIHKSNIPFGNLTISGQNSLQHLLLFFNNEPFFSNYNGGGNY